MYSQLMSVVRPLYILDVTVVVQNPNDFVTDIRSPVMLNVTFFDFQGNIFFYLSCLISSFATDESLVIMRTVAY
jgi:hypothetical protein